MQFLIKPEQENNWKKNSNGRKYRDRLVESFKQPLLKRLDDYYGPKIEQILERGLRQQARKDRKRRREIDYAER